MDNAEIFQRYFQSLGRVPKQEEIEKFRDEIIVYTEAKKSLDDSVNAVTDLTQTTLHEEDVKLLIGKRTELSDKLGIALDEVERKNNYTLLTSIFEDEGFSSQGYAFKRVRDGKARYLFMKGINNTAVPEGSYVFEVPVKEATHFEDVFNKTRYRHADKDFAAARGILLGLLGGGAGMQGYLEYVYPIYGEAISLFTAFLGYIPGGLILGGLTGLLISGLVNNNRKQKSNKLYNSSKDYLNQYLIAESPKSNDTTVIRKAFE